MSYQFDDTYVSPLRLCDKNIFLGCPFPDHDLLVCVKCVKDYISYLRKELNKLKGGSANGKTKNEK